MISEWVIAVVALVAGFVFGAGFKMVSFSLFVQRATGLRMAYRGHVAATEGYERDDWMRAVCGELYNDERWQWHLEQGK